MSEYNQNSFIGGMNLLGDDSRLANNQYRVGFDLTNRYDILEPVLASQLDIAAPVGLKQEMVTFGQYIILFVAGKAYYRYYTDTGWKQIEGFKMSSDAPRYWTCAIPVSTTNYVRIASTGTTASSSNPADIIQLSLVAGASGGNLPGLLVQDNISQPQFIFLDSNGKPTVRTTQKFSEWHITFTDATNTVVADSGDQREYVPIGSAMVFDDGVLYIVSQDSNYLYRSVSGRPLDFVVNVVNTLADNSTTPPFTQVGGGDATTTSYNVGVTGITVIRPMSSGGIFVSASNANFNVKKNMTPNAQTVFGEYTFTRTFLFNANCLSDRVIIDTTGDTRFIDLTGVRSFNAIQQTLNEGRNTPFTAQIQAAFIKIVGGVETNITQDSTKTAAILYNNYELYGMNTIFGPAICKYDTINGCWTSFDLQQLNGKAVKIFAKIELAIQRLYAITEDDQLYTLFMGPGLSNPSFRTIGVCGNAINDAQTAKTPNPKIEITLSKTRVILNKIKQDCNCVFTPYINNRITSSVMTKAITYESPVQPSTDPLALPDIDTQLMNLLYTTPDSEQGWKVFGVFSWTDGAFTQFSMELNDITPMNPMNSQDLAQ